MLPGIRKILYATDLSKTAKHAMAYAMSMAKQYEAEVTVLHVIPDPHKDFEASSGLDFTAIYDTTMWKKFSETGFSKAEAAVRDRIKEECAELIGEGGSCPVSENSVKIVAGDAVDVIVDYSKDYDLVVMGTHGHGRLGGLILGSVAQGVIARCNTPVTIVRLAD